LLLVAFPLVQYSEIFLDTRAHSGRILRFFGSGAKIFENLDAVSSETCDLY